MQLSNVKKIIDPLGRYFTAPEVSRLLIDSKGISNPRLALELGSGDGSLVGQAAKVWNKTRFITVDVDKGAASANWSWSSHSLKL